MANWNKNKNKKESVSDVLNGALIRIQQDKDECNTEVDEALSAFRRAKNSLEVASTKLYGLNNELVELIMNAQDQSADICQEIEDYKKVAENIGKILGD